MADLACTCTVHGDDCPALARASTADPDQMFRALGGTHFDAAVKALREAPACERHSGYEGSVLHANNVMHDCDACARLVVEAVQAAGGPDAR